MKDSIQIIMKGSIERIPLVSPMGVWCKGGSRNVLGWRDSFNLTWEVTFNYLSFFSTKSPFHVFGTYWSHIQDLQEFIRRIFRICRHASCPKCRNVRIPRFWYFQKYTNTIWDFVLDSFEKSCRCKVEKIWFGEPWTRPRGTKNMKIESFRFSQSEIEKLLAQNEVG